ncbi:TonB family protein [Chitinimonas sp. PSY-7]|uniref:TonB family protein n=1 Tax=Chitinimonas sp. PSY-7 TaxID=3459088 RepID=UPI0040403050
MLLSVLLHAFIIAIQFDVPGGNGPAKQALKPEPLTVTLANQVSQSQPADSFSPKVEPIAHTLQPLDALTITLAPQTVPSATTELGLASASIAHKAIRMRTHVPVLTVQQSQWEISINDRTQIPTQLADAATGSANVDVLADDSSQPDLATLTSPLLIEPDTNSVEQTHSAADPEKALQEIATAAKQKSEARAEQIRVADEVTPQKVEETITTAVQVQTQQAADPQKITEQAQEQRRAKAAKQAAEEQARRQAAAQKVEQEKTETLARAAQRRIAAEAATQQEAEEIARAEQARKLAEQRAAEQQWAAEQAWRIAEAAKQAAEEQARRQAAVQKAEQEKAEALARAAQSRIAAEAAARQKVEEIARAEQARRLAEQKIAEQQRAAEQAKEQARLMAEAARQKADEQVRTEQTRKLAEVAAERQAARRIADAPTTDNTDRSSINHGGTSQNTGAGLTLPISPPAGLSLAERALQQARQRKLFDNQPSPRKRFAALNRATAASDVEFRFYGESWRLKVERIGAMYSSSLPKDGFYSPLQVTVAINSDGTLASVYVRQSSGDKKLDEVAKRIVEASAPFSPFPPGMRERYDQVEITRNWNFTDGTASLVY